MNNNEAIKPKRGISRLLEIAGEKRSLLVISGVLSILSTLLMFFPFVAVYFIIAELMQHAADPALSDMDLICQWGLWALYSLVAALIFLYASTMASHISAFRILYNLRIRLAEHLAKLPMGYHTRQSSGAIKKILELSVEKIEIFIAHQLPDMVGAVALPVIILTTMFLLDWRLAIACTLPILGAYLLQAMVFYGERGMNEIREYHNALEKMNAAGVEYVKGMPAIKVFGLTVNTFSSFHNAITDYRNWAVAYTRFCKRPYAVFTTILVSLIAFILPVGVFILSGQPENQAFAISLMLFLVIAPGLSSPMMKLMHLGGNMRIIAEGVERIDEIFAQEPIPEPLEPEKSRTYAIEFEQVGFSYQQQEESTRIEALRNISFTAREGELTALVGPSGSGKSTIANLIPRFWDVNTGSIYIGGIDVRHLGTEQLMDLVSFVFQDVHLFYDTIEENIRMGCSDASLMEVEAAARAACCHDFIACLPEGYQTRIGEGGTYLSGGEAQRIAIARAILKNSPILVLDEATAFADPENESKIQAGLSELIQGKTVIIIAHRLSSIREADQILVLDEGQIVEQGRHDELLEQGGLYRRMWLAHIDADAWTISAEKEGKAVNE